MRKNILLIFGGESGEHEVSRISASSIFKNLDTTMFNIYTIGITKDGRWLYYYGDEEQMISDDWTYYTDLNAFVNFIPFGNKKVGLTLSNNEFIPIDIIFPVLHGPFGEDGTVQGLFELSKIPYVGCNLLASSCAMDKIICSKILESENIPQVPYTYTTQYLIYNSLDIEIAKIEKKLKYPIFVKPANLGSSVGISKASNREELLEGLSEALAYDNRVILEQGLNVRELEIAILGNDTVETSVIGEILPDKEFYDYEDKYICGNSRANIPAELSTEMSDKIKELAIKAFKAINASGLARIDFFIDVDSNKIYLNEINTLPGFTGISMYPKLWEKCGIEYSDLLTKLITLSLEK